MRARIITTSKGGGGGLSSYARGFTKVVAASDSLDTSNADYVCDGTDDQVEIQQAIDAVANAGGGTVKLLEGTYNIAATIDMKDNVVLKGSGYGTYLKAVAGISQWIIHGGTTSFIKHTKIQNMRIENTDVSSVRLIAEFFDDIEISGCYFKNTKTDIFYAKFFHSSIHDNYFGGTQYTWSADGYSEDTVFANNVIGGGLSFSGGSNNHKRLVFVGNLFIGDTGSNYNFIAPSTGNEEFIIMGNIFRNSGRYLLYLAGKRHIVQGNYFYNAGREAMYFTGLTDSIVKGNIVKDAATLADNTYQAILVTGTSKNNLVSGNKISSSQANKPQYGIKEDSSNDDYNEISNNVIEDYSTAPFLLSGVHSQACNNSGETSVVDERKLVRMKNTSGSTISAGSLVVLKSVAAGNEVTTTTTKGDDKAFGMVVESIDNNAWGYIQVLGKTTQLKVNGTDAIAVGDFITTYTEAGIGCKAGSGDMAIAIALEAYSNADSNGVIDALLITPRKI